MLSVESFLTETTIFCKRRSTLTLAKSVKVPLGPFQRRSLEIIDTWDFSGVKKKTKQDLAERGQHVDDDYLDRGIEALKRYFAVALLDPLNPHAVSLQLDPFWHAQILFTTSYRSFCERTIGQFMDHEPLDHSDLKAVGVVRKLYDYTCNIYTKIFGQDDVEFFARNLPDAQLVCIHYTCTKSPALGETVFAHASLPDPRLTAPHTFEPEGMSIPYLF